MELLRERRWRRLAEVRRHRLLQRRPLAAAVLAAGRGGDRLDADVVATAPVARDPAERREASLTSVRGDADAVDACAADDADAPAVLGAGAEDGEGVVADGDPGREAARTRRRRHLLHLGGEVDAGQQQLPDLRDWAVAVRQAGLLNRLREQVADDAERAVQAEVVRRALGAADERKHPAVVADEREVGLPVAAVDGEHERAAHRTASRESNCGRCARPASRSSSVSRSACGAWPTSGCASSAL